MVDTDCGLRLECVPGSSSRSDAVGVWVDLRDELFNAERLTSSAHSPIVPALEEFRQSLVGEDTAGDHPPQCCVTGVLCLVFHRDLRDPEGAPSLAFFDAHLETAELAEYHGAGAVQVYPSYRSFRTREDEMRLAVQLDRQQLEIEKLQSKLARVLDLLERTTPSISPSPPRPRPRPIASKRAAPSEQGERRQKQQPEPAAAAAAAATTAAAPAAAAPAAAAPAAAAPGEALRKSGVTRLSFEARYDNLRQSFASASCSKTSSRIRSPSSSSEWTVTEDEKEEPTPSPKKISTVLSEALRASVPSIPPPAAVLTPSKPLGGMASLSASGPLYSSALFRSGTSGLLLSRSVELSSDEEDEDELTRRILSKYLRN